MLYINFCLFKEIPMATKGLNIAQVITMYLTRGTPAPNFEADLPTYKPSPRLVWLCIRQSLCFFHTFSTEDALGLAWSNVLGDACLVATEFMALITGQWKAPLHSRYTSQISIHCSHASPIHCEWVVCAAFDKITMVFLGRYYGREISNYAWSRHSECM